MSVAPVDAVLLAGCLLFALSGLRHGFLVGMASSVGVIGGGLLGVVVASLATRWPLLSEPLRLLVAWAVVVALSWAGFAFGRLAIGSWTRRRSSSTGLVRRADAVAGGLLNVAGLLLAAWLVSAAAPSWEHPRLAAQFEDSELIAAVVRVVPPAAEAVPERLRGALGNALPDGVSRPRPVAAADPDLARSRAVELAPVSVLRVTGVAARCPGRQRVQGTAFVFARDRLLTNAHVVAGVQRVRVQTASGALDADVVLFDPDTDVAVLYVPGLRVPPLRFSDRRADRGAGAVVAGYPKDGPFDAQPARVRGLGRATFADITGVGRVTRDVYDVQAVISTGNSGGPLLTPDGRVLGMITAAAEDLPGVGYVLTSAELSPAVRTGRTATVAVATDACPARSH